MKDMKTKIISIDLSFRAMYFRMVAELLCDFIRAMHFDAVAEFFGGFIRAMHFDAVAEFFGGFIRAMHIDAVAEFFGGFIRAMHFDAVAEFLCCDFIWAMRYCAYQKIVLIMSNVLKPKHSLIGKNLLSLILEAQGSDELSELARLKENQPLECYTFDELASEFHKLTGETARSVLRAVGKGDSEDAMRRLMHYTLVAANTYGLPMGQVLVDPAPQSSSTSSSASGVDSTVFEARMKSVEQSVSDLRTKTDHNVVEDALRQVRILASRPKLTQAHNLVDVSRQASHKDADFYSKALSACRRYDENDDKDKKISSAIAEWAKGKNYDQGTSESKVKSKDSRQCMPSSVVPPYPFAFPGFPLVNFPYSVPLMHFGHYGGQGYPRFRARRQQFSNNIPKTCYFCKQTRHFLADCPKGNSISCKRLKLSYEVPIWESSALDLIQLKSYRGWFLENNCDFEKLRFRDPNDFVAGSIHNYLVEWEKLEPTTQVLGWLREGVKVQNNFRKFKGNFKGKPYDCDEPPAICFPNSPSCQTFATFIAKTLLERLKNGSILVWVKVGQVEPPNLVMPLTVEPNKPRLCHDERFVNLWIVDIPFKLDTLKEVPRMVGKSILLSSVDDKSGYDHVRLHMESRKYFGFQFGGWYFVYATIPFGFKLSAYVYRMIGLTATSYCRKLGVPCLQYIDDRLVGEWLEASSSNTKGGCIIAAMKSLYIVCEVLIRLGYFLAISKCIFEPSKHILQKERFSLLREDILAREFVDLKTLQRFAGKCISFVLAVPGSRLYSREVNIAISLASKNFRPVKLEGKLKEEINTWRFLDDWKGFVPWRSEKHLQVSMATDSSGYKWGALVFDKAKTSFGDVWDSADHRPIHLKETDALINALTSLKGKIENYRVDAYVDNKPLMDSDTQLNDLLKKLFEITQLYNLDLKLHFCHLNIILLMANLGNLVLKILSFHPRSGAF
ncbi:hypothetical protein KUTeg_001756 [Tegillarca granosa]|uniref:CCHC-type domain-containing protein n=1 Tax=Tegillarca granosa TaxID=220873 RepID=A0ABQ9FSD2_TEGGR|nr:hypothetical protein KUTeg_001756 [Tegillarca granosa]